LEWLNNIELETNYLVSKGFSWRDVRIMESWRRKKYCQLNNKLDKDRLQQFQAAAGSPQTKTLGDFL
jgi:hypothetical protein